MIAKTGTPKNKGDAAGSRRRTRAAPGGREADLDLRRTPQQARGQATFERILDATGRMLDAVGTEGLTTNLIAREAGVNVATLYQYFPNKQAVLLALFQRQSDDRIEISNRYVAGIGQADDWRRWVLNGVRAVAAARNTGGAMQLRLAMRSSPDLLHYDHEQTLRISANLANELTAVGVTSTKAALVARCAIEAMAAVLDLWQLESGGRDDRIVREAGEMLCGYLAPYLEQKPRRATRRR